jgi:hypothetical protein
MAKGQVEPWLAPAVHQAQNGELAGPLMPTGYHLKIRPPGILYRPLPCRLCLRRCDPDSVSRLAGLIDDPP